MSAKISLSAQCGKYSLMENPVFNIKKVDDKFIVWVPHLGILTTATDLESAMTAAETEAHKIMKTFAVAGVALPQQMGASDISLPISPLIKANLLSFAIKSVLVSTLMVVLMLIGSTMLPVRGFSDFADFVRLVPPERITKVVNDAKAIGKVSRPVFSELGIGCSCVPDK